MDTELEKLGKQYINKCEYQQIVKNNQKEILDQKNNIIEVKVLLKEINSRFAQTEEKKNK